MKLTTLMFAGLLASGQGFFTVKDADKIPACKALRDERHFSEYALKCIIEKNESDKCSSWILIDENTSLILECFEATPHLIKSIPPIPKWKPLEPIKWEPIQAPRL